MFSPRLVTSVAAVCLTLCLTGCIGFSTNQKSSTAPPADFSVHINPGSTTVAKGSSTNITASIAAQGSFTGMVQLALSGAPAGVKITLSSDSIDSSGNPSLAIAVSKNATPGTYNITLIATSGDISHTANLSLVVSGTNTPDFSLAANPSSQSIAAGGNTSFNVNVAAINSFTGTVSLTVSGLPSGMQATFAPASISGSGTATLNVTTTSGVAAGTYGLTIAGASGALSHSTIVSVTVAANVPPPDFTIAASPSSQTITAGGSTSFTISVAAKNGFSGTVALVESGMPAGMSASCSPASISSSGNCTLNISTTTATAAGTYTLTITGTSGTLTHSTTASVKVNAFTQTPDFAISATPNLQSITAGKSTTFTASVTAQNGFSGTVSLGATGLPSGMSASFVPASITTSGTATLTLSSTKSTAAGSYTLTISGTSGTLSHNTNVSVTVSAAKNAVALNVLQFPGAGSDPEFRNFLPNLLSSNVVSGTTIGIEWGGSDQGPSAGSSQYDWSYPDAQIQAWVQAGKKVNFVVWATADNADNSCGTEGQYGADNTGNCAIPAYVWTALGSSNITSCVSQFGTQQMPNYFATAFQNNYQKFMAAMIQHYKGNANIGYIRFGLGHGGESFPVANWNDATTQCGQDYVNNWGLSIQTWENYLASMLNYEGSLNSPIQLMVGVTPMGNPNSTVPDYASAVAVQNNIGFGSQGLEESDVNNCSGATADWCELFAQYTGQVPLELQTYLQSCPDNSCTTGSLVDLIPFAVANHATVFELYYQDWLVAYDSNYPGYYPAYQPILQAAAGH